jgi:small acid-soluble spore protein D (minor alpha/beta-type SASP)
VQYKNQNETMTFKISYKKKVVRIMAMQNQPTGGNMNNNTNRLNQFKIQCATEIGRLQYCKENNDHYKGDLTSRENGQQGGPIGGQMVKRMIEMAKQQL